MTTETNIARRRGTPWRIMGWGTAGALLLLPLIAGAPWTPLDYVFAAAMFGLVGLCIELTFRASGSAAFRTAVGLAVAASFLSTWINAAVGIIGSEQQDVNMLFLGVIVVALVGSASARFRAGGMARAIGAAAVCQLAVPVAASAFALAPAAEIWSREVVVLSGAFAAMWLLSAWLFRKAARDL